ncbi:MAG: IS3 family transposase [Burkholderiales bacterium]|nr:IS3 family transposase [Burkholderiales bacterium]
MARYGQEFKNRAIARLLPPESASADEVSREIGVSASTLERWRSNALSEAGREQVWTAAARFEAVLTTASMDEQAKSAWCRSKGVYLHELMAWQQSATQALAGPQEMRASPQQTQQDRKRIKELERDLRRKEKALAEAAALLVLSKKPRGDLQQGHGRGRMTSLEDRRKLSDVIGQACHDGARLAQACELAGISARTLQRWRDGQEVREDARPAADRPKPSNALSEQERERIMAVVNEPRFADVPPARIVPMLADEGVYLASESTLSRLLREHGQNSHRGRSKSPSTQRMPTTHVATGPRQVWCWDMTYLPAIVAGRWFYLYLIMDLYSRKIVGWEVHDSDDSEHAKQVLKRAALVEGIAELDHKPVLHGDNGATLKATTVLYTLHWLGVKPSYSRPRVSDDNAFVEALFRTAKYCPQYPSKGFADLQAARQWASEFVHWYNMEHRHSGIQYVTPAQRHSGQDMGILRLREQLYEQAKQLRPQRWASQTRNWDHIATVTLNPERDLPVNLPMCNQDLTIKAA